jgi:hypothetical protein
MTDELVIQDLEVSIGDFVLSGPEGFETPTQPEADGCGSLPDLVVKDENKKQAKRVTFQITFLDEETDAPLFVTPPSFDFPNYAQATLLDVAIPVGGELWRETCRLSCSPQSSTDDKGVARITIPVLERELPHLEHLSGSFAYHKMRPDLGLGAWEFAGDQYAIAANKKKETISKETGKSLSLKDPIDIQVPAELAQFGQDLKEMHNLTEGVAK